MVDFLKFLTHCPRLTSNLFREKEGVIVSPTWVILNFVPGESLDNDIKSTLYSFGVIFSRQLQFCSSRREGLYISCILFRHTSLVIPLSTLMFPLYLRSTESSGRKPPTTTVTNPPSPSLSSKGTLPLPPLLESGVSGSRERW